MLIIRIIDNNMKINEQGVYICREIISISNTASIITLALPKYVIIIIIIIKILNVIIISE